MNKIVLIANAKFEPGLIAFLNSYKLSGNTTPIVIIDTGLEGKYPHETIKRAPIKDCKHASWMTDGSPYYQLQLGDIDADKIIYFEADMLVLGDVDYLFNLIQDSVPIAAMDDAAFASMQTYSHIDSAGRYFNPGTELAEKYKYEKGWNGGFVGGSKAFYKQLQDMYKYYLIDYEDQYRLLAQSLFNQYVVEQNIVVRDVGFGYNFSGINEYYHHPELYDISFDGKKYGMKFNGIQINVVHFTGKDKPFLNNHKNVLTKMFDYYYNRGRLV
jgi:lipopolysaccharide biosynthesis glycosyltransferase